VNIKSLFDRHRRLLESTAHDLDVYLSKTLPRLASHSPDLIQAAYTSLTNSIKVLSRLLTEFSANLAPVLGHAKDALNDRATASEALDVYERKMARVRRHPEDEALVTEEREALLVFVECLRRLNLRANTFCDTLHPTYGECCRQLGAALGPVLEALSAVTEGGEESDEERELVAYLAELWQDV
jgi:hypothetical protein